MTAQAHAELPVILFVDDEENILSGIKRMLRSKRSLWTMEFVTSGAAALEFLKTRHVDVVVTDMRMPQMDGAELLAQVQALYPDTVRIVLSGYANREAVLRTIGPSHRYLAKPCREDVLVGTIESSLRLRASLASDQIKGSVSGLARLPTLPRVYERILQELASEIGSADTLAQVIEEDIATSAQLLKLTNSSYFGTARRVATVKQAVQFLGFENVRAVVLLAGVFEQFRVFQPRMEAAVELLSQRSLALGIFARTIYESLLAKDPGEAFSAGLLTHVGTLLLIANAPEKFTLAMAEVEKSGRPIEEVERSYFGASHAELGAYLLNLWGFNHEIVEAVAHHHLPSEAGDYRNDILIAVHVAQFLMRPDAQAGTAGKSREPLDIAYLEKFGLADRMPVWRERCAGLKEELANDGTNSIH